MKKVAKVQCQNCGEKYDPLRYSTGCPSCSMAVLNARLSGKVTQNPQTIKALDARGLLEKPRRHR